MPCCSEQSFLSHTLFLFFSLSVSPFLCIFDHSSGREWEMSPRNILTRIWHHNQFSLSVTSDCLRPHGWQHSRPPCPPSTPGVYSNSCPLSWWCHPTISSSVIPFSSHLQSFPASRSFPMSQHFAWGGQSIGVSASASVLPMNTQDWFPLGWILNGRI